jgi:eukaryotic-like serine/threonine-protein kinase
MPTSEFDTFARLLAGQYELEREIGRGGMGVVYLARDVKLDRPVAIKTLPPHLAGDAAVRERFVREARTAAKLSHPNIVPIYRADEIDGQVFFVMGFVNGDSLAERVKRNGPLDSREVRRTMHDVAAALGFAAAHGVIHRDVKAENILIESGSGTAMVTDFGIARLAEAAPLTATGQVLGTVYYMSPEQVAGEPLDGRTDLYSLGVAGFYALTGRFPFDATLASAVLVAHVTRNAPPVLTVARDAPRALAEIIDRCLAKDPAARFQTGQELADALTRVEGEVARDAARAQAAPAAPALLSETEAQAIWKRAAELQAETGIQPRPVPVPQARDASGDASRTSGYALAAVRDAAAGAGIPAQYVDHAMAEHGLVAVDGAPPVAVTVTDLSPRPHWIAGASKTIEFEGVVNGEMSERDFDLLADTIRRRVGEAGALAAVGRSLTWNTLNKQRTVHVSVLARNGRTTVRAIESMGQVASGLFGGIIGGAGGGMTGAVIAVSVKTLHSPKAAILLELGWLAAMYGLARGIFAYMGRKRKNTLRQLTEELTAQIRDAVTDGSRSLPPARSPALNR